MARGFGGKVATEPAGRSVGNLSVAALQSKPATDRAVQALLETGCDVTLVDNRSLTAAQLADKCDQSEAAALIRGEVTLEQLFIADALPEEFQHPEQSPRLSFPPPPLFPPEEEPDEISYNSLTKAIHSQNLEEGTVNIQSSVETATSAATGNPLRREPSQALSDSPPPYPSPPPPDWLDSPGGDSTLPPPPPTSPPAPLYLQPYPEEGLESSEQGRQPLPLVDNTFTPTSTTSTTGAYSNSNSTSGYSNHTGSERHLGVRRTISAVSVDSSASDPVGFEITTVTADVHKSRGSIDSINGLQTLAYSSNDSINNSNIITVSNGKANAPFQKRKFSVLKYLSKTQDAQIQEKPELENNNSIDQRNHTNGPNSAHGNSVDAYSYSRSGVTGRRYSSTRQRPPSPGLPTPPPLSLQSNSFHDLSTTPPTSYNSHDTEFPPPPPSLPPASALKDSHHLPFEQAESWSLSEELPPPPPISNSQSSGQDFTDDLPPPPSHFTTASSNSSHNNHTSSAASTSSTSHFKQYFDSGTRASFARAKAIFGAFSEANTGDGNVGVRGYSKSTSEGRKQSARPHSYPSQHCINPDSGEVEFGPLCDKIKKNIVNRGVSSKSQPQEFPPPPRFLMDASAESSEAQEKNASATPTSPTLSDQSGLSTESAQSEDSVLSVVTRQGGHVTIISMSGAKDADSPSKLQARDQGAVDVKDQQSDHASPGSQVIKGENSTRAPVPVSIHTKKSPNALQGAGTGQNDGAPLAVSQTPAASSNGVVMRAGDGQGAGRAKARTVVSAGPELLNGKDKGQTSARSSQPVNPGIVRRKNDLIADIQSAVSGTSNLSLRPARSRGEGVSMVYSSKRHSTGQDQSKMVDTTKPLTGQFDPKNFLDEIEKVDSSGRAIPEWRRHVLAKHAAEKAQKEFEEKRVVDDYEARFKDMPAWKRALIERREALAREEEAASKK
ncbi:espin [Plakobranchus ocellatus]|uniref:Espin n=1 Tax=Plakobranchus ocellatus TaxID=259542 RepID=A0AAV3Z839_9GAST|nr:espin [Plakobranchus ocellatus]